MALGPQETADLTLDGEIRDIVYLGSYVKYRVAIAGGKDMIVHVRPDRAQDHNIGDPMRIGWQRRHHRIVSA